MDHLLLLIDHARVHYVVLLLLIFNNFLVILQPAKIFLHKALHIINFFILDSLHALQPILELIYALLLSESVDGGLQELLLRYDHSFVVPEQFLHLVH